MRHGTIIFCIGDESIDSQAGMRSTSDTNKVKDFKPYDASAVTY
jgi:hypothetical protein